MKPRTRLIVTSPLLRWSVVVVVIAVGVAVAVWPRGDGTGTEPPAAAAPSHSPSELAAARHRAALPGCTSPGGESGSGPLASTTVSCLGTGKRVSMADVLGGRPTLLNVWATWCTACKQELPVLESYANGNGIRVVEVLVNSPAYGGLDKLQQLGVRLPTVHDGKGALSAALRLPKGLPASYLVDASGAPHFIGSPRVFHSLEQVRHAVTVRTGGGR